MRESLISDIEQFLGYDNTTEAVLIGAGKLGRALLGYSGFAEYGLEIAAAFDTNEAMDGEMESGKPIYAISRLPQFCKERKVLMGIITVPPPPPRRCVISSLPMASKPSGPLPQPTWMYRPTFWSSMRIWPPLWPSSRSTCRPRSMESR